MVMVCPTSWWERPSSPTATLEGSFSVYLGDTQAPISIATYESQVLGGRLGTSVAIPGDVNGDGFDEVLVGGPGLVETGTLQGGALLYSGGRTGLAATPFLSARGPAGLGLHL